MPFSKKRNKKLRPDSMQHRMEASTEDVSQIMEYIDQHEQGSQPNEEPVATVATVAIAVATVPGPTVRHK